MKGIWKFRLPIEDYPSIEMPVGAKPLFVAEQNAEPFLWALVDPDDKQEATEIHRFRVVGTGHRLEDREAGSYVGSLILQGGLLVFHVFDLQ